MVLIKMVSTKKKKQAMLKKMPYESLEKIANTERISIPEKKTELLDKLVTNVSLQKTRIYSKNIGLLEGFSVFKHKLVPKHRIMSEDEKDDILERYGITINQLPRIRLRDPAVMELGAREGDLIEIERESRTAGKTKYYRIVVRGNAKK